MAVATTTALLIGAGVAAGSAAYSANQQKKAAEAAAKGESYDPQTSQYLQDLQSGAMDAWDTGQFQFGSDPNIYNSYLDWGGNKLGLDTGGIERLDPAAQGYGPEAYGWMQNFLQGGSTAQPNPAALVGVQNPWAAGLMGGVYGYGALGGFDPKTTTTTQPQMQTAAGPSVMDAYQSQVNIPYYGGRL